MNCVPLTVEASSRVRSGSGSSRKKSQLARSAGEPRRLRAPCRSPCGAGWSCPWPGRPGRTASSRCNPRAPPGACSAGRGTPSSGTAVEAKPSGAPASVCRSVELGADRRVRADQRALVALDAERRVPGRDLERDVALLESRRAGRPAAVERNGADGHEVALVGEQAGGDLLHKLRGAGVGRRHAWRRRRASGSPGSSTSCSPARAASTAA